jgi:hypothetical protein
MDWGKRVAISCVIGGSAVAACGPPAPPGHDVEIVVNGGVQFAVNVGLDSYAWDTMPIDLGAVPTFTLESNSVGVNFRDVQEQTAVTFPNNPFCTPRPGQHSFCLPFTLRRIPELHLFERDPRTVYFDLIEDPFDNPWNENLSEPALAGINTPGFELPADVVIPYGRNSAVSVSYPTYVSIASFGEQDFLRAQSVFPPPAAGPTTTLSQWAQPDGKKLTTTSIKAARLLTLPECSRSVNIQSDVFSGFGGLINGIGCDGTFQASITAASYLTHQDPNETNLATASSEPIYPWDGVFGGVMVNGFFALNSQAGLEACTVSFTYDLRYALAQPCAQFDTLCEAGGSGYDKLVDTNGVLTINPIRIALSSSPGFECQHDMTFLSFIPQAQAMIQNLFETEIPSAIFTKATAQQGIPPAPIVVPNIVSADQFQCEPISLEPIATQCGGAIEQLRVAAIGGGGVLGLPDSSAVVATFNDPANWRCRPATAEEVSWDCSQNVYTGGRCQFIIPASSLIAEPDEVRVGWAALNEVLAPKVTCATNSDCASPQMCDPGSGVCEVNPSSAAFVAAFGLGLSTTSTPAYEQLCSPPVVTTSSQPYYQRYFASLAASVCAPQPPPPGPPCTGVTTNCNSVCVDESTDFNNCGSCSTKCPIGNGLTYGGFSCQGGACMPSLTCACAQDINCIDIMGNGARCTSGLCIPSH